MSHGTTLSIITPSYGQAAYLEECLASVAGQLRSGDEHIVVDGGSADGSREIIERHAARLKWWCCERDAGQSDAINKGLAHAEGTAFTWVNSDDALWPGALKLVAAAFDADPALIAFGGRVVHRDAHGDRVFEPLNDARDALQLFRDPVINQPATWYRTEVVREIGGVDAALRYVMDVELWWQVLFRHGTEHLRFEPVQLAMFRLHDESKTVKQHDGFLDEVASILHGMCLSCGLEGLAEVLAEGHPLKQGLRGVPVAAQDAGTVKGMVLHFLLKWHGRIHTEPQYRMMRMLKRHVRPIGMEPLHPSMQARWDALDAQLTPGGWAAFRLRRKWKALRG